MTFTHLNVGAVPFGGMTLMLLKRMCGHGTAGLHSISTTSSGQ